MGHILGVDAGATKTLALVGSAAGQMLGLGRGGPGNHQAAGGVPRALACVDAAVAAACRSAGVTVAGLTQAAFCLAGADFPDDYALLAEAISRRWPGLRFTICNDSLAGLRAGIPLGWGAVCICGTYSNAAAIAPDGRQLHRFGLGRLYGDFGGADDLGQAAIRAVFMAAERRGPATQLTEPVLAHLGAAGVAELRERLYRGQADTACIPGLAPLVFATAGAGDAVAQALLMRMGTHLGQTTGGVLTELGLEREAAKVVLAGSTWKGESPLMIDAFRLAVHRTAPRAELVRPRYEPVVGAWLLAAEAVGVRADAVLLATLAATLPGELWLTKEHEP